MNTFYVSWRCPITGQRQRVVGDFAAVERICRRLKHHTTAHRWGTVRPAHTKETA